jgi:hypothetical protein
VRDLPIDALVELYNSAHAFVLPSQGEGWGLTLTEGMATGLPCIWTAWSAMLDYADSTIGYPIGNFKLAEMRLAREESEAVGKPAYGADLDPGALMETMDRLYHEYRWALQLGRRASERMHTRYTWRQAAEKFVASCERACRA